jgi:hypothetical protein
MKAVTAFLAKLTEKGLAKRVDDVVSRRKSVLDSYSVEDYGSLSKVVSAAIEGVGNVGKAIAGVPGDKHMVVISRNEVDDIANPIWGQKASQMRAGGSNDVMNSRLQTELMVRDITLARESIKKTMVSLGLTLHSIGGMGEGWAGAYGEAALASGGNTFRMGNDLSPRLSQALNLWATRYELNVALPAGVARPAAIHVESTRKGLKLFAPTLQ